MKRINEGYEIIYSSKLDDGSEIVLGYNAESKMYVTWQCTNGNNYFWGHYSLNEADALADLAERIRKEKKL